MIVDVVLHPRELFPEQLRDRVVLRFRCPSCDDDINHGAGGGSEGSAHLRFDRIGRVPLPPPSTGRNCCAASGTRFRRRASISGTARAITRPIEFRAKQYSSPRRNGTRAIYAALHSKDAAPHAVYAAALVNAEQRCESRGQDRPRRHTTVLGERPENFRRRIFMAPARSLMRCIRSAR